MEGRIITVKVCAVCVHIVIYKLTCKGIVNCHAPCFIIGFALFKLYKAIVIAHGDRGI